MNDKNASVPPEQKSPNPSNMPGSRANPLLIFGVLGCSVLICTALFVGSGILYWQNTVTPFGTELTPEEEFVVTPEATGQVTEFDQSRQSDTFRITTDEEKNSASDSLGGISATDTPRLGRLTFASDTTKDGEPIAPNFIFETDITELHAVFEYAGMSPEMMWTQIWYHNGDEILSTTQPWIEGSRGVFDYVIKAGNEPFSPGEWTLELYVEDELLSGGSFLIKSQNE